MSDRFYTTLKVGGSNAEKAKQAAIEAMRNAPRDALGFDVYNGSWSDEPFGRCEAFYFDHDSGEGAIKMTAEVSRDFPTEMFELYVGGGMGEGVQGPVIIFNGQVTDLRSDKESYGDLSDHELQISRTLLRDIFVDASRRELCVPFSNIATVLQLMCQDKKTWDRVGYHEEPPAPH